MCKFLNIFVYLLKGSTITTGLKSTGSGSGYPHEMVTNAVVRPLMSEGKQSQAAKYKALYPQGDSEKLCAAHLILHRTPQSYIYARKL